MHHTLNNTAGNEALRDLERWWTTTSASDIENSLAKIREYGGDGPAHDLLTIGRMLGDLREAGSNGYVMDDEEAVELGIFFYLRSKLARWEAAVKAGRRPSDDTLLDLAYYAMMARRVRQSGGWPTGFKVQRAAHIPAPRAADPDEEGPF